jgi:ribose transport system substrate-binding protein
MTNCCTRRGIWLLAAGLTALAMAGCGDDSGESEATAGGESGSGASAIVEQAQAVVDEAAEIPTEILASESFSPPANASVYHVACDQSLEGCADKAKSLRQGVQALGWEFDLCDGGSAPDQIAQCFQNAVNAKPDVIVTNGIAAEQAGDSYAGVAEAGIPHVGMFTGNEPGQVEGVVTEVGGDACGTGAEELANWVIADSGGEANVLFVATDTFSCNKQRLAAFQSVMENCDGCAVDTLKFAIDSIQSTLPQQLQAELQSNPDIDYVVGTFDAVALVAADQVRQAGKADAIKVAGFDGNSPNLELMQNGDIQAADVATGGLEPGWVAADAAARILAGQEPRAVTPVTNVLITQENVGEVGDSYDGPEGFQEQFKELWGR